MYSNFYYILVLYKTLNTKDPPHCILKLKNFDFYAGKKYQFFKSGDFEINIIKRIKQI